MEKTESKFDNGVCENLYDLLFKEYLKDDLRYFIFNTYDDNSRCRTAVYVDIIDDYVFAEDLYNCYYSMHQSKGYDIDSTVSMPIPGQRIVFRKTISEDGQPYISIKIYNKTNKLRIKTFDENKWYLGKTYVLKTFIIHDDGSIYTVNNKKYYPSTVRDMSVMPVEMQKILFSFYAKDTMIWKDFIADDFYPPISMNEISEYHNKREFFEKEFGMKFSKSSNAKSFQQLYCICCAAKFIKQDQIDYLMTADCDMVGLNKLYFSKRNKKKIAKAYINQFLKQRLPNINADVLHDYVEMAIELKEPIDIKAGKKRICEYHNYLADKMIIKVNRGKKFEIPETPLKYLSLPEPFCLLKTKQALINEGERNRNCVGSYVNKINQGKCVIYTANINDEHLTIDIRYRKYKGGKIEFYVNQCYKSYNRHCKEENMLYVKQSIEAASADAVKKYNVHIKK